MQILNVNVTLDPVTGGGSAERTLQISRALSRAGHTCIILTIDTGLSSADLQQWRDWGLNIVALPSIWRRFYLPKIQQRRVQKLVEGADIVNLMSNWTLINAVVYRSAKKLGKPYTVCPAGALPLFGRSKILKKIYSYYIGLEIILRANGHIAISSNEIGHFKSYGVQPDRVTIIPNGINPDDFSEGNGERFRKKYGIGDAPMILFLGRLNIIKGPDMLLEAFCRIAHNARMKPYHIVFAGSDDGGVLDTLNRMVGEAKVKERVHFIGHVGGSAKADVYQAADFLVIPSRQEAMSIVVLEAGITGTPVLITDQCGFDDVAAVMGGVVVEASVEGLREGLLAMAANTDKLKIMGQKLEKFTRENFLWEHAANKYLGLFSKILN